MSGVPPTFGTNLPPVSFPGVASGIDYNSIIAKLSALAYAPATQYNTQIQNLTAQNSELIKINGLLASVQNALTPLSQPNVFQAITASSSNTSVLSATPNAAGGTAAPGVYTIDSVTLGTQTTYAINELQGGGHGNALDPTKALSDPLNNLSITPTVPQGTAGSFTINGKTISYNLTTDTVNSIVAKIAALGAGNGIASAALNAGGQLVITSTGGTLAVGSAGDIGNLVHVLKLDTAVQVGTTLTSSAALGGASLTTSYNATNNAGFSSPVTGGTLTINGVNIQVNAGDNLNNTISAINASAAGVVANYDPVAGTFTLSNKSAGAQSITISDTSGLSAALGLNTAVPTVGTASTVTYTNPAGATTTVHNSTNSVTTIIPGLTLNLLTNDAATPFTVSVAADPSQAISAINAFVSVYNAAINEINQATAAPVVTTSSNVGATTAQSKQAVGGGVLFGNSDVIGIKDRLVGIATSLVSGGNNPLGYNSFSSIGLLVDDSFSVLQASSPNNVNGQAGTSSNPTGASSSPVQTQTYQGTSGQFQALNAATFTTAFSANPGQVASLFTGAASLVGQLGSYLTQVTGVPTTLGSGLAGQIPSTSIIQDFENMNTSNITSLQQQVALITDSVNLQADTLRQSFISSEAQIANLQSLQSQLGQLTTSFSGH